MELHFFKKKNGKCNLQSRTLIFLLYQQFKSFKFRLQEKTLKKYLQKNSGNNWQRKQVVKIVSECYCSSSVKKIIISNQSSNCNIYFYFSNDISFLEDF